MSKKIASAHARRSLQERRKTGEHRRSPPPKFCLRAEVGDVSISPRTTLAWHLEVSDGIHRRRRPARTSMTDVDTAHSVHRTPAMNRSVAGRPDISCSYTRTWPKVIPTIVPSRAAHIATRCQHRPGNCSSIRMDLTTTNRSTPAAAMMTKRPRSRIGGGAGMTLENLSRVRSKCIAKDLSCPIARALGPHLRRTRAHSL